MSGQFYDNADRRVYRFPAAAIASAAVFGRFIGPSGKKGRVRGIEYIVTTGVTVAAATVTVGNNGATAPPTLTVPIASANAGGAQSAAQVKANGADEVVGTNDVILDADTVVECASDGASTAGAADIIVTVDWF